MNMIAPRPSSAKALRSAHSPSPRYVTGIASSVAPRGSSKNATANSSVLDLNLDNDNNPYYTSNPPLPSEPSGLYHSLFTDSDMALTKKKFVKVNSIGALDVEPNRVEFCIQITTNKTDITQAKESVKKRTDFVLNVLKKFKIPDEDVTPLTIVRRKSLTDMEKEAMNDDLFLQQSQFVQVPNKSKKKIATKNDEKEQDGSPNPNKDNKIYDGDGNKALHPVTSSHLFSGTLIYYDEISIKCESLIQYLKVFSICNEKLDHHVTISKPVVRFTPDHIQSCSQKAIRLAMKNAVQKAVDLIGTTKSRGTLGKLYYSVENSITIEDTNEFNGNEPFETFTWKRLNKIVKCELTSVFEIEHPVNNTMKNRKFI